MQPSLEGGGAGGVGSVDAHVGPFVEQGAVEAFDFAVPGGPAGWEPSMLRAGRFDGSSEGACPVAGAVVGLGDLDANPEITEPRVGTVPERDRGRGLLVGKDFAVGESAVAVDRGVDERVTDTGVTVGAVVAAPVGTPSTAGGDTTQLLDVDLELFA